MNDIIKFLVRLFTQLFFIKYTIIQMNATIANNIIGRRASKKSLKTSFDSKGPLMSLSLMNQSKERKESDEPPILWRGPNILVSESG